MIREPLRFESPGRTIGIPPAHRLERVEDDYAFGAGSQGGRTLPDQVELAGELDNEGPKKRPFRKLVGG